MTGWIWGAVLVVSWGCLWLALRAAYRRRTQALEWQLEEYKKLAFTDSLTGTGNRRGFDRQLEKLACEEGSVSIASLDLNGLKRVNDAFGHAAGDRLLQKAAGVLETVCAGQGEVYRVGGDEFCVVAVGLSRQGAQRLFDRLTATLRRETVDMALGWEFAECGAAGCMRVLHGQSDRAMYQDKAKQAGANKRTPV